MVAVLNRLADEHMRQVGLRRADIPEHARKLVYGATEGCPLNRLSEALRNPEGDMQMIMRKLRPWEWDELWPNLGDEV